MSGELLVFVFFLGLMASIALGLPVSFSMGGISVLAIILLWGIDSLFVIALNAYDAIENPMLVAIPLFILMAFTLERAGIADDMYKMMHSFLGRLRGGLCVGTILICTIIAAMSGLSGTGVVTMGVIALPAMLERKYDKKMAIGSILAGGGLGILIPPSVGFILYGMLTQQSVGQLFLGGLLPGLLLSLLFIIYVIVRVIINPELAPALPIGQRTNWREKLISLKAVAPPIFIIISVLGAIFAGIASPTEAAGLGCAACLVVAVVYRKIDFEFIKYVSYRTVHVTSMLMWLIIGAFIFSSVFTRMGAPAVVETLITGLELNRWLIIIAMQISYFIMGCFLDLAAIIMITIPVYLPIIVKLGFDPLWFGILFMINMEMAYLTPPLGLNLFYMKSVTPEGITMRDIYLSIIPFVGLQIIGLAIVMIFPQIALWLPQLVFG